MHAQTATDGSNGGDLVRVLVVDDHELVRHAIVALICGEPDMDPCGEAADASEALRIVEKERPNVAVIDISLEGMSGLELVKQITARFPETRTLVLSMHDEKLYAERSIRAGASGYLSKKEPAERVIEAIREAMAGRIHLSGRMTNRILQRLARQDRNPEVSPIETLSDRELEVLELIGRGLTTRKIAEELSLSRKTVDTYRDHLKKKLQVRTANELLRWAVAWSLDREPEA